MLYYIDGSLSGINSSSLCKGEGGSWSNGTSTIVRTCTGTYNLKTTKKVGSKCTGNPVVYDPEQGIKNKQLSTIKPCVNGQTLQFDCWADTSMSIPGKQDEKCINGVWKKQGSCTPNFNNRHDCQIKRTKTLVDPVTGASFESDVDLCYIGKIRVLNGNEQICMAQSGSIMPRCGNIGVWTYNDGNIYPNVNLNKFICYKDSDCMNIAGSANGIFCDESVNRCLNSNVIADCGKYNTKQSCELYAFWVSVYKGGKDHIKCSWDSEFKKCRQ